MVRARRNAKKEPQPRLVALMVDVDPGDKAARDRQRQSCWLPISGKHRDRDAACDALEAMLATRH
jgi:hypothetical protein